MEKIKKVLDAKPTWAVLSFIGGAYLGGGAKLAIDAIGQVVMAVL